MKTGLTKDDVLRSIISLKNISTDYIYVLPSPNEGKHLIIRGPLVREEAAEMARQVWNEEATIDYFSKYMTETDVKIF